VIVIIGAVLSDSSRGASKNAGVENRQLYQFFPGIRMIALDFKLKIVT
jgi:hypothetical protein